MKYSILHISDIHKSPDVDYDSLLQSLKRDLDSYTINEGIEKPTFIVISGDLIQGAYTDDEINRQYKEVETFLSNLCDLYLGGNRTRCIMVPGNHDVNRRITKNCIIPSARSYIECLNEYFRTQQIYVGVGKIEIFMRLMILMLIKNALSCLFSFIITFTME